MAGSFQESLCTESLATVQSGRLLRLRQSLIEFIVLRPNYRLLLRGGLPRPHIQTNRTFLMNLTKKPHKFPAAFSLPFAPPPPSFLPPLTSFSILSRYKFYLPPLRASFSLISPHVSFSLRSAILLNYLFSSRLCICIGFRTPIMLSTPMNPGMFATVRKSQLPPQDLSSLF